MENIDKIGELIVGRVEPHIYAFSTDTFPDYLKVGDTYRPLPVRLREWRRHFSDLKLVLEAKAWINPDVFFRDYSIHDYLAGELGKHRLLVEDIKGLPAGTYYSKEFFKDTSKEDIEKAIDDIKRSYEQEDHKYQFYDAYTTLPETYTYASTGYWEIRPNQKEAIHNFIKAVDKGRTNLLMYAVMRFGKSFTSLCCAKEKGYKTVLVVSAKADVREEWKKTVQSADNLNQDYVFLSSDELIRDQDAMENALAGGKGVVVFLTLQDLQGREVKEKHKKLFESEIDLMIIDETHYGARAKSYGQIIRAAGYAKDIQLDFSDDGDDYVEAEKAEEQLKAFHVKIKLHLSGTPYRILMGSEFSKEDIVSFCQFSDIVKEQKVWDELHILSEETKYEEWENPYFGFPQMIRFAFNPSASALKLLESLKSSGTSYALSELFKPLSIVQKKDGSHKRFIHEKEVLELMEAIDGSKEDESIFAFLDYDKIHEGKMCRHLVIVLPYCASCDALEQMLSDHAPLFKNLGQYEIINISGVEGSRHYKTVQSVKGKIKKCEQADKKTLTLTVNRMLTGSTVEQWDTMIFLKDTASAQEYDQAVFRLQNQYVRSYMDGRGREIKYNMKPQTLLVDFDPHRMFRLQEQKSLIYNVNTDSAGNDHLKERMEDELNLSPIITVNKGRLQQVEAADILAVVSEYSSSRGVKDEALDIPVDDRLFDIAAIKSVIERQAELGLGGGLRVEAHQGEKTDFDQAPDGSDAGGDLGAMGEHNPAGAGDPTEVSEDPREVLQNKFRTYYSRILFFAYLTEDPVSSLAEIAGCSHTPDNERIMKNLDLDVTVLELIIRHMNPFILNMLDFKIQNISQLSQDDTVPPIGRAMTAIGNFGKLSESEVTTPVSAALDMIQLLPRECLEALKEPRNKLLDIASKMGEFAIAVCRRCEQEGIRLEEIRNSVEAVCTSSVAYEFTRKVYKILGLNRDCIAAGFTAYDLLTVRDQDQNVDYEKISALLHQDADLCDIRIGDPVIETEGEKMNFNAVVGNPPYQADDGGAGASSRPIYPAFVDIARNLQADYVSLIIPTRWYTGGKGGKEMERFRNSMLEDVHIEILHDCLHPEEIFPDTNNRGGVCYFLWNSSYDHSISDVKVYTHREGNQISCVTRPFKTKGLDIFIRNYSAVRILNKVMDAADGAVMSKHVSSRKPFGIESNIVKGKAWHLSQDGMLSPLKCVGKGMRYGYVEKQLVTRHEELIPVWKVFTPRANNVGTELNDDNLNTFVGGPDTICTEAYIVLGTGFCLNEASAGHLADYFKTKFVRFMHSLAKASHDATSKTYRFVPVQDFSEEWTDEKLYKKYGFTQDEIDCIESSIKGMEPPTDARRGRK